MPISGLRRFIDRCLLPLRHLLAPDSPSRKLVIASKSLTRDVLVDVYQINSRKNQSVFFFLDGQDLRAMPIMDTLRQLVKHEGFPPFTIVGVHANAARMQEYGTLSTADYAGRGKLAPRTADFIYQELLPYLQKRFAFNQEAQHQAVAGFSLGALLAFDLAWHYPQQFGIAGIFSGALWWRSKPYDKKRPDANRILHTQVSQAKQLPTVRYWFQAGTEDEKNDRNQNGIIDAIDDTLQLIELLRKKGQPEENLTYHEVPGGRHEPATWGEALPHFLRWAMKQADR